MEVLKTISVCSQNEFIKTHSNKSVVGALVELDKVLNM